MAIFELVDNFQGLLNDSCVPDLLRDHWPEDIMNEWSSLKNHLSTLIQSNPRPHYLGTWAKIFTLEDVKHDCPSILRIIKLRLNTLFTNAKLERLFSRLGRVKSDWRTSLSRNELKIY